MNALSKKKIRNLIQRALPLISLVPAILFSQGQSVCFVHLTPQGGLSQSRVSSIYKDSQGFMWFGTADGVNRYDGLRFRVYKYSAKDSTSILSSDINSICETDDGNLWFGTSKGISIYVRDKDMFDNNHEINRLRYTIRNKQIYCIEKDIHGNIWVGTHSDGIYQISQTDQKITHYIHEENNINSLSGNRIASLYADSRGNVWIGTLENGLLLFEPESKKFSRFVYEPGNSEGIVGNDVEGITEDLEGNVWVGCEGSGVSKIIIENGQPQKFINYQHEPDNSNSLGNNAVSKVLGDSHGRVWIGTINGGLDCYDPQFSTFTHYRHRSTDPNSLNNNAILAIYEDNIGDFWIGTASGGINVLHKSHQAFMHFLNIPGDEYSLSHNSVWDFAEDTDGTIWIATDGGGLNHFYPQTGQFESYQTNNSNLNVNSLLAVCCDQRGGIWVGTWAGGMSYFDKTNKQFRPLTVENGALPDNRVFDIIEDESGFLWIATMDAGIVKFDPKDNSFQHYTAKNSGLIYNHTEVLTEDSYGHIYIGGMLGFNIYDPRTDHWISYKHDDNEPNSISHGFITSFYEQDVYTMWIGTMRGLNKYDKNSQTFTHYFEEDGLPGSAVNGICQDEKGYLWISTNNGLARFDPIQETFDNYNRADGLQGNEFIKNSSYRTRDNHLLFGGVNGFNYFDPQNLMKNDVVPPVVITGFGLMNKPIDLQDPTSPLKKHISQVDEIVLSHEQNIFSFSFAVLNYVSSQKNQCAYMLEGFDKEWQQAGPFRMAFYTNIDPGRYVFRVKGSNNDGVWNEEGASVRIVINPPFWVTFWFRMIVVLVIIMSIALFIYMRTRRFQKQNTLLEKLVQKRTADLKEAQERLLNQERMAALGQIVATVAHEIRNPLGTIRSSLFTMKDAKQRKEGQRLNRAMDLAERNILRCDNIVTELLDYTRSNEVKKERVEIVGWIKKIIQELSVGEHVQVQFLQSKRKECRISKEDMRRAVVNVVENAVQAMKSDESFNENRLTVSVKTNNDRLELCFQDTGPGIVDTGINKVFEPLYSSKSFGVGLGLPIVKKIMESHQGGIEIMNNDDRGVTVVLWLPLDS